MADQGQNIEIFLAVLREVLPTLKNQSDAQLVRRIGKEKIEDAAADMAGFIESGCTGTLTKNERLALSGQVIRCLTKYIQTVMQLPVSLNTIINSAQLMQHATDQAFPGYASSRLLRSIIQPLRS